MSGCSLAVFCDGSCLYCRQDHICTMQYAIFIFRFIYYTISSIQMRIKKNAYPVTPRGRHNINPSGTPIDNPTPRFHVGVPRIIGGWGYTGDISSHPFDRLEWNHPSWPDFQGILWRGNINVSMKNSPKVFFS